MSDGMETTVAALQRAYVLGGRHRRLYLVRHAEADRSAASADPALSPRGQRQAHAVAERLRETLTGRDVAVAASPLRRAAQTADAIAAALGAPARRHEGLVEVGGLDVPAPVVVDPPPGAVPQFRWAPPHEGFRQQAVGGVEAVLADCEPSVVVAVTHGGLVNAYVAALLGLEGDFFHLPRHTALALVRVGEGRAALERLGDAAHLD